MSGPVVILGPYAGPPLVASAYTVGGPTLSLPSSGGTAVQSFTWTQSSASAVWTIVHNLGYNPAGIVVTDSIGDEIEADTITFPDVNTLVLTFSAAITGTARLS